MHTERPTPAMMSQEAARKLPRYALLVLLILFISCGLWVRDFWTIRDAASFGIAINALEGDWKDLLLPNVGGQWATDNGPLSAWVGLVFIGLLRSFVDEITAYRATSLFWFAITTASLWYGTWNLARRPEAQPVAFAFGGEANPRDYGRVIADSAVLLFVATFGIVTRQHEPIPDTALLALAAVNFYGLARMLRRPYVGSLTAGLSAGLATLASTVFAGVWLLAAGLIVNMMVRAAPGNRDLRFIVMAFGALLPPALWAAAAWCVDASAASAWFSQWAQIQAANFGLVSPDTFLWFARNFAWYLCPIWPLVVWGLYSWRHQLERTHLFVPLAVTATSFVAAFFSSSQSADTVFLDFIPAMSAFAAFSLITVRRSQENVLDWFSLSIFSLAALFLWAYRIAWQTDIAPKMTRSLEMLAPEAIPSFDFAFCAALLATVLWFTFVGWRLTHRPVAAWRGPWLAACGMTVTAVLTVGLFHNGIDINRSYEPVAKNLRMTLKEAGMTTADCVSAPGLPIGLRAMLLHYADIPIAPDVRSTCRFRLLRTKTGNVPTNAVGSPAERPHTDEVFYVIAAPRALF